MDLNKKTVIELRLVLKKLGGKSSGLLKADLIREIRKLKENKIVKVKSPPKKQTASPTKKSKGWLMTFFTLDEDSEVGNFVEESVEMKDLPKVIKKHNIHKIYLNQVWHSSHLLEEYTEKGFFKALKNGSKAEEILNSDAEDDLRIKLFFFYRQVELKLAK